MSTQSRAHSRQSSEEPGGASQPGASQVLALVLSWTAVGIPLAWGVAETFRKTLALFQ